MYSDSVGTAQSPSLEPLAPGASLHVHPLDLERIGVAEGQPVTLTSSRTSVVLPVVADDGVVRGTVWAPFNQPGTDIRELIDIDRPDHRRQGREASERLNALGLSAVDLADPLLISGEIGWREILIIAIKVLAVFTIALVSTIIVIWFERKAIAGLQNRIGPNKAGPYGLLQTLADGLKLILKEGFLPDKADPFVYKIAPYLSFVPAFLVWSIIPLGGDFSDGGDGLVTWFGRTTQLQLIDPPVGVLLLLVLSSIAVYGIMLAGWSSGSKYPLLGSVRASSQMVSYEAGLGLSLATVILLAGTLSTHGIVDGQSGFGDWNIVATGLVPFVIFMICATAEMNRPPFDLVEAEQELVGGFNTEYAGFRFALFYIAEFMNAVTMSAHHRDAVLRRSAAGLFDIPLIPGGIEGTLWLLIKVSSSSTSTCGSEPRCPACATTS